MRNHYLLDMYCWNVSNVFMSDMRYMSWFLSWMKGGFLAWRGNSLNRCIIVFLWTLRYPARESMESQRKAELFSLFTERNPKFDLASV